MPPPASQSRTSFQYVTKPATAASLSNSPRVVSVSPFIEPVIAPLQKSLHVKTISSPTATATSVTISAVGAALRKSRPFLEARSVSSCFDLACFWTLSSCALSNPIWSSKYSLTRLGSGQRGPAASSGAAVDSVWCSTSTRIPQGLIRTPGIRGRQRPRQQSAPSKCLRVDLLRRGSCIIGLHFLPTLAQDRLDLRAPIASRAVFGLLWPRLLWADSSHNKGAATNQLAPIVLVHVESDHSCPAGPRRKRCKHRDD